MYAPPAKATDEIVCKSKRFNLALAVGDNGFVASVVAADESGEAMSSPVTVERLKTRYASVAKKTVRVEGWLPGNPSHRLVVKISRGQGWVAIGSRQEWATCDWLV